MAKEQAEIQAEKMIEKLKTERTNLRRIFTQAANKFDKLHSEIGIEGKNIYSQYNKIVGKAERLFQIDDDLKDLCVLTEEDFDIVESYRDRYIEIKTVYEIFKDSNEDNLSSVRETSQDNLKLPKLILKEYDLIPRNWVAFWGQYCRIHEDENLREEDKFQYLLSSLKPRTRARDIADSYPPSKKNYQKVIEHLKSRFGRDDLLIETYIRDLLNLVSNRSNTKLSDLYDKLGSYLRALETLGVTTQNYAAMLYPVVESCLPPEVLKAWDRYRLNREIDNEDSLILTKEKLLENLMSFLGHEVESEEHRALAESGFSNVNKTKRDFSHTLRVNEPTASALSSLPARSLERENCIFCDRNHASQNCAKEMKREDRKSKVLLKKCCLVCLKPGHFARTCRSAIRCLICARRHYPLLCPDLPSKLVESSSAERVNEKNSFSNKSTTLSAVLPFPHVIYLKTVMIRLCHKGKQLRVRALLDDGSHRSYIARDVVKELKIFPCGKEVLSQGLFGGKTTPEMEHGSYLITVKSLDNSFATRISFLDQPKICTMLPRIRDENLLSELAARGITLTDVGDNTPPIRVLLGADILGNILTGKVEILKSGISAIETRLGWSILGLENRKRVISMVSLNLQNFELQKLWDLETLGITDPVEKKTKKLLDEETLIHFQETVKKKCDGRYEVALPWLAGHPPLYNNYDVAESRLRSVTKRLKREQIYDSYRDIFLQWKNEGIIEDVNAADNKTSVYFLPHRPVIKLSSATTKIRPVFDASVKSSGSASLNDCLSVGPSLSQQIPPLLNRFRLGLIGVTADIKKAFLQLSIRPEDRDVLRFLWWRDEEQISVKEYRHCRVVFGVTSSPFLLNATISHHLDLEKFQNISYASTIKKLKEGFYIDNFITSVDTEQQFQDLQTQAREILAEGCFDLRCWSYTGALELGDQTILGLKWNVVTDKIACAAPKVLIDSDKKITKRSLLSIVNSVYDPIGFTSPALLLPKLLLQEAWKRKISWDEPLPEDFQVKFKNWSKHLHVVEQCSIPRRMLRGILENATLHIFSDASAHAYACCVFLRSQENSEVYVHLVSAKSRIAPMNKPTIPRMELLGAAIAARLANSTLEALQLHLRTYFWCDSMVVLSWLTKKELWNSFVGNRVKEIQAITDVNSWRYVPGELNPADIPSRSCTWSDLLNGKWWEGPPWLKEPETSWPHDKIVCPEEALLEKRKTIVSAANLQTIERVSDRFLYFSKYTKMLRMIVWIFRFSEYSKKERKNSTMAITAPELERAETALIKMIQREWSIENMDKYKGSMKFYEDNGILKVKTRLVYGDDSNEFQCPTVLPDHPIVRRLIEYTHKSLNHAGVQTILTHLRERFWIPRGRRIIREVISGCIPCKRHSVKAVTTETAPLPVERMQSVAAFQVTGADLAGPIFLRAGMKAWIVLFTCAIYRAIHLELITSLSTEAFIQSMRRFIARRGRISVMYTDNGTNFVGTSNALQSLDWETIEAESATHKIKWNFNPPSAPWYGGWWERMVRIIKDLLKRNLGKANLNYEEMSTILCDCENTINKRPLTYLSEDPNEPLPLRPVDFLHETSTSIDNDTFDFDIIDGNHLRKRIRYMQKVRDCFRKRFRKEYLSELVRNPENKRRGDIQVGDIALVGSENTKRINWPLARVEELYPGRDGIQRVARLKLANRTIIRPLQRLYPLEIRSINFFPDDQAEKSSPIDNDLKSTIADFKTLSEDIQKRPEQLVFTRSGRQVKKPKRLDL